MIQTGLIPYRRSEIRVTRKLVRSKRKLRNYDVSTDTETSLCDPSSVDGQSEISSLADLAPSDFSELEDNPKPKINNELLNLEIIRLNEQKRCLQEEIKTMEDMVQVAVKEKTIFQQSAEEFRSQVERLSEENKELKLNSNQTEEILQNQSALLNKSIGELELYQSEIKTLKKNLATQEKVNQEMLLENNQYNENIASLTHELENINNEISSKDADLENHQLLMEENHQLRMKSHAEFEFNSDLMKESQSRDVTIENLIQRNKDLVVQNDKLNVKCFEAAKMINGLGIELAKLKDENRDFQMNNSEMIEVVNQLESRCQVLMDINQNLSNTTDHMEDENARLQASEQRLQFFVSSNTEELSLLRSLKESNSFELKKLRESETSLNQRVVDKNEIIQQQANTIRSMQKQLETIQTVPNQPKNFHTKSSQTRKREERNNECQTSFQIDPTITKKIKETISLIEAETQTENFDSLKSLRRYRKRNRQLEIVYENTAQNLKRKKERICELIEENKTIEETKMTLQQMLSDEQLKNQSLNAKMSQFRSNMNQSNVVSAEELNDLKKSEKELRNRLHMAELSSARLLRRARSAEAKYLETNRIAADRRRKPEEPDMDKINTQMKCLRARVKLLNHQVDQCATSYRPIANLSESTVPDHHGPIIT